MNAYAGKEFGDTFFNKYIYKSGMPDYKTLFKNVGVTLATKDDKAYFGTYLTEEHKLGEYPPFDTPAYNAGLTKGDKIVQVVTVKLTEDSKWDEILSAYKPRETVKIIFERYGETRETSLVLAKTPDYSLSLFEKDDIKMGKKIKKNRKDWLGLKD